jgi:hypothetical protein
MRTSVVIGIAGLVIIPPALSGQSGGFVVTLGTDTVHLEHFVRRPDCLEGTIVVRTPDTRLIRYAMTFDAEGRPTRYETETLRPDGVQARFTGGAGSLVYGKDSVIRETLRGTTMETTRLATTRLVFPVATVPFIGVSFLMYELAFAEARRSPTPGSVVHLLSMHPAQTRTEQRSVWFVGGDSAEMSYFGLSKSGYKFDGVGQLVRADWTGTTYRYRIRRIPAPDIDSHARTWSEADRQGNRMGALSPRDTSRATIGTAHVLVDYGRPARRGRVIWGELVPWGQVWRLGANFATHLVTDAEIRIGETDLPAGTYTLWMLPDQQGRSQLIINGRTRIFGTSYDSTADVARVPLTRVRLTESVERLSITVQEGRLWVRWGDRSWWVSVTDQPRSTPRPSATRSAAPRGDPRAKLSAPAGTARAEPPRASGPSTPRN